MTAQERRQRHDSAYRQLFSEPRMVEDLIRGYVHGSFVEELDFPTLERYPGDRITVLAGRARLPPVLPLVLYNGLRPWNAARQVSELITALPGLEACRPSLQYLVLGEHRLAERLATEAPLLGNLVSVLFALEHCGSPEEIADQVVRLESLLLPAGSPGNASLRRAFTAFLTKSLLPGRFPDQPIPGIESFEEIVPMLRDTVINWRKEWRHMGLEEGWTRGMAQGLERGVEQGVARGRQEGRREGRQEGRREGRQEGRREGRQEGRRVGRQEGRREGETAILRRLLEQRFGTLPPRLRQRLEGADSPQLTAWGERLLTAGSLEEVFGEAG